jgi:uncharacterized protein YfaS (alpha-2-macroglobulin family)
MSARTIVVMLLFVVVQAVAGTAAGGEPAKPVFAAGPWTAGKPDATYNAAEKEFGKGNFNAAADGFAKFVEKAGTSHLVPHARLRMAQAAFKANDFDRALTIMDEILAASPGTLVEARTRVVRGELALKLPAYCFKKGSACRYNADVREGQEEYAYVRNADMARTDRETARVLFGLFVEANPTGADPFDPRVDVRIEAMANNRDLAAAFQNQGYTVYDDEVSNPGNFIPDLAVPYESLTTNRQKVLYLLSECDRTGAACKDKSGIAECRLQKALFLAFFPEVPPKEWVDATSRESDQWAKDHPDGPGYQWPEWKRPAALDPLEVSASILADFPGLKDIDRFEAVHVRFLAAAHRFADAVAAAQKFIKSRGKSTFLGEVKLTLDQLTGKTVSIYIGSNSYPGRKATGSITTRNLDRVDVEFFKVPYDLFLASNWFAKDAQQSFSQLLDSPSGKALVQDLIARSQKKLTRTFDVEDPKPYEPITTSFEFDLPEQGLYIYRVRNGKEEQVGFHSFSDFILVTRTLPGKTSYYVADAVTGQPLPDVPITVRETFQRQGLIMTYQDMRIARIVTDKEGLAEFTFTQDSRVWSQQASAFASHNSGFAMSEWDYPSYYYGSGEDYEQQKGYIYTDRPVYRPGDSVRFRLITRDWAKGQYRTPDSPRTYHVQVSGPTGNIVADRTEKSDLFGTLHSAFDLGKDVPLGVYYISVWQELPGGQQAYLYLSSGTMFRVEEYKKPEVRVDVVPSTDQAMAGDKVKATIRATYYFGGAVAGADVHYSISRSMYYHYYTKPSEWDWLYGQNYYDIYGDQYYGGNEPLQDGDGKLDDKGELTVDLPVLEPSTDLYAPDYRYFVTATVTDLSRRGIQGSGSVVVSHKPFFIHFDQKAFYYVAGDQPDIEVLAMTANDTPVEAAGTYTLYTRTYEYGVEQPKLAEVASGKVALDTLGRAVVTPQLAAGGDYRLTVRLKDAAGREATSDLDLYVLAKDLRTASLRFSMLTLIADKAIYAPGETVRLLLGTRASGWVLITTEGGGTVLSQELRKVDTTGTEISVTLTDKHLPNFFVSAVMVHSYEAQNAERQVFVPPGKKMLKIALTTDKKVYQPGDRGKVEVKVTDADGKPVEAQIGLALFDSSVLYIQPETRGDIRQFFHGQVRYHGVSYKHSGYAYYPQRVVTEAPAPAYQLEGLPFVPDYGYGALGLGWGRDTRAPMGAMAGDGFGAGGGGGLGRYDFEADQVSGELQKPAEMAMASTLSMAKAEAAAPAVALEERAGKRDNGGRGGQAPAEREFFPDTILWAPTVVTDKNGIGKAEVTFPDSLTTWAVRAVGIDHGDAVGQAEASTLSSKDLVARIETPRFLVEGDKAMLAAVVRSTLPDKVDVELTLKVSGSALSITGDSSAEISLAPGEEKRVDFPVTAVTSGEVRVSLTADAGDEVDALARTFPVVIYGADTLQAQHGEIKGGSKGTLTFKIPADRVKETTQLTIAANASVLGVLLSTLPYLLDYPYGCVEQTVSRFLPAAMVRAALKESGLSLDGIPVLPEKADLANPVGLAGGWYYKGVFSDKGLDDIVASGLARLAGMQGYDGGWGWWGGFESDPYMTAYVLSALAEARAAGIPVNEDMLYRASTFLSGIVDAQARRNVHVDLFVLYALSAFGQLPERAIDNALESKDDLSPYGKALLALTLHNAGKEDEASTLVDNLVNVAWVDLQNGTASFRLPGTSWWWWWEDRTETVAWALRAVLAVKPGHEIADRFARWLVQNREGSHFDSTKSTAMAVLALVQYAKARGGLAADFDATVRVNGDTVKEFSVRGKDAPLFNGSVVLSGSDVPEGDVVVEIAVEGKGTLYANAFVTYFSKEARIPASGSQIAVARTYYRLTPVIRTEKDPYGKPVQARDYERSEIRDGDSVASGDLVEVHVVIDAPNDYEYLVFEDPKPAGFEAVGLKSGYVYENGAGWYREYRDRLVASFLSYLGQGKQTLTYQLRAEIPGTFHALPHRGYAMYAPRVRATSDSTTMIITP